MITIKLQSSACVNIVYFVDKVIFIEQTKELYAKIVMLICSMWGPRTCRSVCISFAIEIPVIKQWRGRVASDLVLNCLLMSQRYDGRC